MEKEDHKAESLAKVAASQVDLSSKFRQTTTATHMTMDSSSTTVSFDGSLPQSRKSRKRVSEADLLEEKLRVKAKNMQTKHASENDKLAERRAANRLSAFQSRQRRKIVIDTLQQRVSELTGENGTLRTLCLSLHQQNLQLRSQLQASQQQQQNVIPSVDAYPTTTKAPTSQSNSANPIVDMLLGEVEKICQLQGQLNKTPSSSTK